MSQRTRKLLWAAVFSFGAAANGLAQTWISTGGSWSEDAKWSAPPLPSPSTSLMFPMFGSGTLAYTTTNDLPGPFTLHDIAIAGVTDGSLTIGAGGTSSLRFNGAFASLQVSTGGSVLVNARTNYAFADPLGVQAAPGGTLTLAGMLRAPSGLNIGPSTGVVSLLSENRVSSNVSILSTTLNLGNVDSLGNATLSVTNASLTLGSSTFATAPGRAPFFQERH